MNSFLKMLSFMAVAILFMITSSCISPKKTALLRDSKISAAAGNSFENAKKITYQLQTGDYLYIKVYSVDAKTNKLFQSDFPALMNATYLYLNSYLVDEQGYISFSFIDKIYVRGLTIEEAKKLIQKTINDYFKDVTVIVRLVNFEVAVLGEVSSPGNYSIDKDQVNIFQVIGYAGGFKDYANIKKVKLIRQTAKGSEIHEIDLSKKDILQSDFFYLMPNDIVYVEPSNSKAFLFPTFPYGTVFSVISFSVAMAALLK